MKNKNTCFTCKYKDIDMMENPCFECVKAMLNEKTLFKYFYKEIITND